MPGESPKEPCSSRWRSLTSQPRRSISPAVALLLHALVAVFVWRLPVPKANVSAFGASTLEVPIEIVTEAAKPDLAVPTPVAPAGVKSTEPQRAVGKSTMTPARDAVDGTGGDRGGGVDQGATGGEPNAVAEGPTFARPPAATDIGLGGVGSVNRFLPRSESEVEAAAKRRERDDLLRHTGWERDRALGLGPEGPVLTALSEATSQSIAPVRGRAIFVATTNAAGEVESLELLDAEGGRPGWADARRIAAAALVGKKLRIPPSAKRVQMRIEITSAWKLPSGQDPGTDVTLFHIPVAKGEGKDSAKVNILDPIPKVRMANIELAPGVVVPVPTITLEIFGATTDPSNFGAKPRRVIHSHLVDSTVM